VAALGLQPAESSVRAAADCTQGVPVRNPHFPHQKSNAENEFLAPVAQVEVWGIMIRNRSGHHEMISQAKAMSNGYRSEICEI
jgi:hypothetical protein